MKKIVLCSIIILIYFNIQAQPSSCSWLNAGVGSNSEKGNAIAKDNVGNIYVAGSFSSPIMSIGNITLYNSTSSGIPKEDIFIVKYDNAGNTIWAKSFGGLNYDICSSIAIDSYGHLVITGYFASDSVSFGNTILLNLGGNDIFVAKLDENGNSLWAISAGSQQADFSNSIAIDVYNNIYIAGSFNFNSTVPASINFGMFTLPEHNNDNLFIAKINPNATVLWAKSTGGVGYNSITAIASDLYNNIFIGGYFTSDTIDFGNHFLINGDSNDRDGFIAKYDKDGNSLWAKKGDCSTDDYINDITTDNIGAVYLTGNFTNSEITFGNITLYDHTNFGFNIYVSKYDASGNIKWAEGSKNNTKGVGFSISADADGNAYLAGAFQSLEISFGAKKALMEGGSSDVFIAKFNQTGIIQWINAYGGAGQDKITSMAIENAGAIYLTGYYNYYYLPFSNCTAPFPELSDEMFCVKLNAITGILENTNKELTIMPNPALDYILVNSTTHHISKVVLTSVNGDFIDEVSGSNSFQVLVQLDKLPPAMYFIVVYANDGKVTHQKIIKA